MRTDVPSNANAACVGTQSNEAGKASSCQGCPNQSVCASGEARAAAQKLGLEVEASVGQIKHKLLVLSGKGGVGKSTFSAQMAFELARRGHRVGLLDIDICGPSIPHMLGLRGYEVHNSGSGWSPVYVNGDGDIDDDMEGGGEDSGGSVAVVSVGFMLPDQDSALVWRGPRKTALIKQFLTDVDWGELDYLVIDTPPGTSDEHISIVQYLKGSLKPGRDGAVVVTTPQEVAMADVREELNFCKKTHLDVLGIVENMSGLVLPLKEQPQEGGQRKLRLLDENGGDVTDAMMAAIATKCPELLKCSFATDVFVRNKEGPEGMAEAYGCAYLGKLPLDTEYLKAGEQGKPVPSDTNSSNALKRVVDAMLTQITA
eukprot:Stramenopile-MAST_4_protein_3372